MEDIELVIKIPEEIQLALINNIQLSMDQQSICDSVIKQAIINGIPLPKDKECESKVERSKIMSNAKKCDICGAFYDTPVCNDAVRIRIDFGHEGDRYVDLCEDCYNRLCDFVKPTLPKYASVERKKWYE